MMKIITIANTKGGTGKSTIATNLAVEFANAGHKTLAIDTDTQQSLYTFYQNRIDKNFECLNLIKTKDIEIILRNSDVDVVIIDSGGRETDTLIYACINSSLLFIPTNISSFTIWSLQDFMKLITEIKKENKNLIYKIIPNMLDAIKVRLNKDFFDTLYKLGYEYTKTKIHNRIDYQYALDMGQSINEYNPGGKAAAEMKDLIKEIESIGGKYG